MIFTSLIITCIYVLLIGSFILGFDKIPVFTLEGTQKKTKFSVIIPFRDEAENLPDLLKSIAGLNYPKHLYSIIFVDDDSSDNSGEIIKTVLKNFSVPPDFSIIKNERKTNSPKKDAIASAIHKAKYNWIVTTDADCQLPKFWLDSFDAFIQKKHSVCIAAPVTYFENSSFLNRFQLLDILSLQGATIGGFGIKKPFLCNGANFAYKKSVFFNINGFKGNTDIASGDDIFLLEKISKKYPKQLHYLKCKEAIAKTKSQPNWVGLFSQRLRWAAKTNAYNNGFVKLTGLMVLLMNTVIILNVIWLCTGTINLETLFYILTIKFSVDLVLIFKSASFFNQKTILKSYFSGFISYPFFSVYIAMASVFSGYNWKGRYFKK
jgi:cellulose synthase/poly-beta-1,6-N-acetylglucosamine synthase-like glycosyltransferase